MTINRGFRGIVLAAAIVTFLLMIAGNAVHVGEAARACPDWPTCYGQWGLPQSVINNAPDLNALYLQYAHRALALLSLLLTAAAAVWAFLRFRANRWVWVPLSLASLLMLVEAFLGGNVVINAPPGASALLSPLHMGFALAALGLVVAAAVASLYQTDRVALNERLRLTSPFARLSFASMIGLFVVLISGTLVTATNAGQACQGFPLCSGGLPASGLGWLDLLHRLIVLAAAVLVTLQFLRAWKSQRSQVVVLPAATGVFLLTLGQSFIGAVKVSRGFPADLVGLHAATAAAVWAVQVVVVIAAGLAARTTAEEIQESAEPLSLRARMKDFLLLNKPIIVLLLLATTYAGMVVGGKHIPSLGLTVLTLVGGALAAGGSSALNQFIDRETDRMMQRTLKRPLPDGRLKPAEALAYGLGACLVAFFLLAGLVNLLSAVLALSGMIYYVLIYSVWLKHITVQNIVIGGGAGAIPPLVGWAAATGALNVPSLFLFAIIFLWTPPHFWALALIRRKDYARGKVPMLPVVRGERETRKQIFIYTLELVVLSLVMPILHMAGPVYFASALVLGLWLIYSAWNVYTTNSNKTAYLMYRYSSMYLAFLMLALVIDVLV